MPGRVIPSPLRDQAEGAPIPAAEAFRPECVRIIPAAWVVVGAIHVEQHPCPFGKVVTSPLERGLHPAADEREEWIEPANLLHEPLQLLVATGVELLSARW